MSRPRPVVEIATKKIRYKGVDYDVPAWTSASTFLKRLSAGQSFEQAVRPPMSKSARGKLGRAKSPFDQIRQRAYLIKQSRDEAARAAAEAVETSPEALPPLAAAVGT